MGGRLWGLLAAQLVIASGIAFTGCGGGGSGGGGGGSTIPPATVDRFTLDFTATAAGADPAPQTITITDGVWSLYTTEFWISATPDSGVGPGVTQVTVSLDTAFLQPGFHFGEIRITDGQSGSLTVFVSLDIPQPIIGTDAPTDAGFPLIEFTATEGNPSPPSQQFQIVNGGGGTLNWSVSDNASWLTVTPGTGIGDGPVTVAVDTTGLSAGFYSADITIFDPNALLSSSTVYVFFSVYAAPSVGATPVDPPQQPIRPDLFGGTSVASVVLTNRIHPYVFPAVAGVTYTVSLDTQPAGSDLFLEIVDLRPGGQSFLNQPVTAPFSMNVTAPADGTIAVRVFDHLQASTTLSSLTVVPTAQPYDSTTFDVVFHFVGDVPMIGAYGHHVAGSLSQNPYFDLLSNFDQQALADALAAEVNARYAAAGAGIQIGNVDVRQHSTATVMGLDPALVDFGGRTLSPGTLTQRDLYASLGVDASDPVSGKALDVFVVHTAQPLDTNGFLTFGLCDCWPGASNNAGSLLGGNFVGKGPNHSLFLWLFFPSNDPISPREPRAVAELGGTLAHEIGHFLTLHHPGNDFQPDTSPSTTTNLMNAPAGPSLSQGQKNAMRGTLAVRDH